MQGDKGYRDWGHTRNFPFIGRESVKRKRHWKVRRRRGRRKRETERRTWKRRLPRAETVACGASLDF